VAEIDYFDTAGGAQLARITLRDGDSLVRVLNYGATTQEWRVAGIAQKQSLILGYDNPLDYLASTAYLGAIVGRVSNRIGGAAFTLNGQPYDLAANEGENQLHGGPSGLGKVFWDLNPISETEVVLTYQSPDGDNGFPGAVTFEVTIRLDGPELVYDMTATVDRATPISLAQHNYYNLSGAPAIWSHAFFCHATHVLERDGGGIMTGTRLPIAGTDLDFAQSAPLSQAQSKGIDDHYIFDTARAVDDPVATLQAPNGVRLRFWSDQLGAQVYTGHGLPEAGNGLNGTGFGAASGFCFEPQGFPNAVNRPDFPSVIVSPDTAYRQVLRLRAD
jgi:aldose 1-epimerase